MATLPPTYDFDGHVLSRTDGNGNTINYAYDALGRLVKKTYPDATTVTFKYDPFGRRIKKRVQTTQNGQNMVNVFIYVYDNEDVILERESTTIGGGAPTVTVKKYAHGPGIDEPLAVARGNSMS